MNLKSLLDKITIRQRERQKTKWSDYRELVAQVCDSREPDPETVASVLAANNRTLEDLSHDVFLLTKRRKLRQQMDAIAPLESESLSLKKQIADGEAELEQITARLEEKLAPLYVRRLEINKTREQASEARRELRSSCEDAELVERYETIEPQLSEVEHRKAMIERDIEQHRTWLDGDEHEASITQFATERKRYLERVESHKQRIANLESQLKPLQQQFASLSQQLATLEQQFLEP